jgi:heme-binding NEAT domain protein
MCQDKAVDVFFLDRILAQKHNQNEYYFLHEAGHMAKSVNLADAAEVLSTLQDMLQHIKTRVLMVVTGDVEGWDVAQLLEDETASVFEVHKDCLQAAHKCAK